MPDIDTVSHDQNSVSEGTGRPQVNAVNHPLFDVGGGLRLTRQVRLRLAVPLPALKVNIPYVKAVAGQADAKDLLKQRARADYQADPDRRQRRSDAKGILVVAKPRLEEARRLREGEADGRDTTPRKNSVTTTRRINRGWIAWGVVLSVLTFYLTMFGIVLTGEVTNGMYIVRSSGLGFETLWGQFSFCFAGLAGGFVFLKAWEQMQDARGRKRVQSRVVLIGGSVCAVTLIMFATLLGKMMHQSAQLFTGAAVEDQPDLSPLLAGQIATAAFVVAVLARFLKSSTNELCQQIPADNPWHNDYVDELQRLDDLIAEAEPLCIDMTEILTSMQFEEEQHEMDYLAALAQLQMDRAAKHAQIDAT